MVVGKRPSNSSDASIFACCLITSPFRLAYILAKLSAATGVFLVAAVVTVCCVGWTQPSRVNAAHAARLPAQYFLFML